MAGWQRRRCRSKGPGVVLIEISRRGASLTLLGDCLTAHAVVVVRRAQGDQERNRLRERLHALNGAVGHVGGRLPVPG